MDLDIKIIDSYRTVDKKYWERIGRFYAENVWKLPIKEAAERLKVCFTAFEAEYAVKWFEIAAYQGKEMVGFMRLLRNPDDDTRWFICDVHTAVKCRRQGIASKMLESAIETVKEFESAEYIISSISASNKASIGLHKKLGFADTGVYPNFANFEFEDDETEFELRILQEYPVQNIDVHRRILYKLMRKYLAEKTCKEAKQCVAEKHKEKEKKQESVSFEKDMFKSGTPSTIVKQMLARVEEQDQVKFSIIWCGNNPVGFKYTDKNENITFITTQ